MNFRKKNNEPAGINITPLIDVVFILLIFFAVTTSFISTSSIKVDLPKAKGEALEKAKDIRVSIDKNGVVYIDGNSIKDKDIPTYFQTMKKSNPNGTVIIEADKDALHGKVVYVIDKARGADFVHFAIATEVE